MTDLRIKATELMIGSDHPTKADTLNRLILAEHNNDGTHKYGVVYVEQYAGIGDGVIDDSQAMQDAINAANTSGKWLIDLNGKTWRITKTVDLKSNVFLTNGTIYVDDIVGDLTGAYTADNYPIVAAFRVQSLQNCGFHCVKFTGNSDASGSVSCSAIYIDYPYTSGPSTVGTDGLFINFCTFTNISRFGITGQCLGGQDWDISHNKFFLSGGALTTLPTYGSQQGIQAGVDIVYDEGGGTPTRSLIDGLIFESNQFIIDCSTQDYHGVAYKIQGARNASVSNNVVRKVGANSVVDHSSAISVVYLEDSMFNGNVCGGNVGNITSLQFQGCVNSSAVGNYTYNNWAIISYVRGAYTKNSNGLNITSMRGGLSTAALVLGLSYGTTYGVLTNVEVTDWHGEIYNYMHTSASGVRVKEGTITRYRNTTAASAGPLILERNTIYASASDADEIFLHNVTAVNNRFIGTATGAAGYYILKIYNTKLKNNTYEYPEAASYTGFIRIYDGTTSEIYESLENMSPWAGQYVVYNSTGTYQKTTIDTSAPTAGSWKVGNRVSHPWPTAGGYIGWVCTTAGSPGTWKTFGAVTA